MNGNTQINIKRSNFNLLVLSVATLIVAGCASPNQLRKDAPSLNLNSVKSAEVVGVCISDAFDKTSAWGNSGISSMSSRKTTDGYSIVVSQNVGGYGKDTVIVLDIANKQSGSNTLFYKHFAGGQEVFKMIRDCQ
jgi:hypothetical protein